MRGASQVALLVKNPPAKGEYITTVGWIPGSGRSPGEGHGNLPQYSCLENPMDRGASQATVHGVTKSWTWMKRLSTHPQQWAVKHLVYFLLLLPLISSACWFQSEISFLVFALIHFRFLFLDLSTLNEIFWLQLCMRQWTHLFFLSISFLLPS